jgi:hypothetical protein
VPDDPNRSLFRGMNGAEAQVQDDAGPVARLAWLVFRDAAEPGKIRPNMLVGLSGGLGVLMWQGPLPPGDSAVVSAGGSNQHRVDYFVAGLHHADFPAGAEIPVEGCWPR